MKKIGLGMSASFHSFEQSNLDIAQDVFEDYDVNEIGCIKREELHLVIRDICTALGVKDKIDREVLDSNLKYVNFKDPRYVTWPEFERLYLAHFNF